MSGFRSTECDVLVIGSGAGGLSAAVTAAWHGLKVIVVEKEAVFGGATAWSGGWMWIPLNPLAKRAGLVEDSSLPRTYLEHELGNRFDAAKIDAFLEAGPHMVSFFERHTTLRFVDGNAIADIHGLTPGAGTGGRSVNAAPYDGRKLGRLIDKLRPPLRETAFIGMPIMAGKDLAAFMTATRSMTSFAHVAWRVGRHLIDLALHGRAMQLVNGNALAARLLKSADDLGVDLRASSPARRLLVSEGAVTGALVEMPDGEVTIRARRATVLAAGGFPNDVARRRDLFAHAPTGQEHWSVAPRSASGDGLRLGESAGGQVDTSLAAPGAWCPVSLVPYADGSVGHFPHIIERAKPGIIGVLADGRRFVNEADGYYDYVDAMLRSVSGGQEVASWLVCDHRFQRRYGLGITRPAPLPVQPYVRSGYLKTGRTIEQLAEACGIDPAGLRHTVDAYNEYARRGEDPAFGRGSTPYNRKQGDPDNGPNPCVAPIDRGPFYAVKVLPGSFGTFAGLKTDAIARVLDRSGSPIQGLHAVGADMASMMGGYYPAGGINLGPAMTFGYIAGRYVAGASDYEDVIQDGQSASPGAAS
jgi:succinate dehydrogenase/fumarate reductase flavoprotein subunit